jgi:glutamate racemase
MKPTIAFFDSGQGGLTVWESVVRRFPSLNTIYLGDNARYPYGNKSNETVTRYASEAAFFLSNRNASLIVVACGTASSVAVRTLQTIFKTPIIGIVEGFCADAVQLSQGKGTIAVLGTRFTVKSRRFEQVLNEHKVTSIWQRACPLFVPLVEEGVAPGPMADAASDLYLGDLPSDVSVVMLACTHFPRLVRSIANTIEKRLGRPVIYVNADGSWHLSSGQASSPQGTDPVYLLDSSRAIVNSVTHFLEFNPNRDAHMSSERHIYCSDAPERFAEVARLFTNIELPAAELVHIGP